MRSVLEYTDYRVFLRDYFESRRTGSVLSYRFFGKKLGIDPSQLLKIVQGQLHVSERKIPDFVAYCKFTELEANYFEILIAYNKAKQPHQARMFFEKLVALSGVPRKELENEQYLFFLQWYHFGIWCALEVFDCNEQNYMQLGRFMVPAVDVADVTESINMLRRLGLIEKNKHGFWKSTAQNLGTGENWRTLAVRQFQKKMIQLGSESLDRFVKEDREVSTLTFNASPEMFEEMRIVTEEYRRTMTKLSNQSEDNSRVYQLNIQLFPITGSSTGSSQTKGESCESF